LAEVPGHNVWEVIYLSLKPAARGCGRGWAVLLHALELARDHILLLELVDDLRNTQALRLCKAVGFVVRDRRAVRLVDLASVPQAAVGRTKLKLRD
jgi:GNAT superfamily N-acetyltransferase